MSKNVIYLGKQKEKQTYKQNTNKETKEPTTTKNKTITGYTDTKPELPLHLIVYENNKWPSKVRFKLIENYLSG